MLRPRHLAPALSVALALLLAAGACTLDADTTQDQTGPTVATDAQPSEAAPSVAKRVDDGTGGDQVSGDGVYTLQFDARASLPEGNITIQIRATDTYLSTTPTTEQLHILELEKLSAGKGGGNWFSDNSTTLVFVAVGLLLIVGITVFAISLRKSDTEW